MCLAPSKIEIDRYPGYVMARCRNCWQCKQDRLNDLVGRCIAEAETSNGVLAVTLTYAGDTPNSAVLVYRDVQNMLKRMRKDGYNVRYICAGEYGSKKGRAHWHMVLFFQGAVPAVPLERRIDWGYWPAGYAYFQEPDYGGFRYVLKYVLKDLTADYRRTHLAMSKKPLLGAKFISALALDYVRQGLAPRKPEYSFRSETKQNGQRRTFWLHGAGRKLFIEEYNRLYEAIHNVPPPQSEWLHEEDDKAARSNPYPYAVDASIEARRRTKVRIEPDPETQAPTVQTYLTDGVLEVERLEDGTLVVTDYWRDKLGQYRPTTWHLDGKANAKWQSENETTRVQDIVEAEPRLAPYRETILEAWWEGTKDRHPWNVSKSAAR